MASALFAGHLKKNGEEHLVDRLSAGVAADKGVLFGRGAGEGVDGLAPLREGLLVGQLILMGL